MIAGVDIGPELALAAVVVFLAGVVRGYTGFGAGLVMAPLLALLWGPVAAVATTVAVGLIGFIQLGISVAPMVQWREITPIAIAGFLFTPIGTYLLVFLDPDIVKRIIAAAVLFAALISFRGWTYRGPRGVLPSAAAGALGALINGVAAVGGPPVVLYLMSSSEGARVLRANITMVIGIMGTTVFVSLASQGAIGWPVIVRAALMVPANVFGIWAGVRLFERLPGTAFRTVIMVMLVAISVSILVA